VGVSVDPTVLGETYPFEPKRLTLPSGHTLSYLDEGPRDAPVLVFVHGNPTWSFYFREPIKALRDRFRCVAIDHIGAGLSDKPQAYPYTLGTHAENLGLLIEHLGLGELSLVVHDWGGAIGCTWAVEHPEQVRRLVVMNTAAFRSRRIPFSIDICRIPGFGALAIRGCNAFSRAALIRAAHTRLPHEVKLGYLLPYGSWADRVGHLRFVQDIPLHEGVPSWPVIVKTEEGLAKLRGKPMLICWGGKDFCFNDSFLEEWQRRFPDAEVHRIADAGHYVLEDAREQVVGHMEDFLARTAEPAPATAGQATP
jgi:haloalkane dehalogenase